MICKLQNMRRGRSRALSSKCKFDHQREGVCTVCRQPPTGGISYKEKDDG